MGPRRWLVLVLVAVVAFVAAFVATSQGGDDDADRPGLDLDELDALSVTARELVALADQGSQVTHHAVYEQPGGLTLEVWTDGTRVREETLLDDGEHRLLIRTPEEGAECVEEDDAWSCSETDELAGGVQSRVEQLTADLAGAEVEGRDDEVADVAVRCFDVTVAADEVLEVCLTREGVLARLAAGEERLELVRLDGDVDDDVFEVPGEG